LIASIIGLPDNAKGAKKPTTIGQLMSVNQERIMRSELDDDDVGKRNGGEAQVNDDEVTLVR
jgi:hypothetical protein